MRHNPSSKLVAAASRGRRRDVKIWYFSPAFSQEVDTHIRSILKQIRERHGFKCRHIACRGRKKQEEYFEKYFTHPLTAYLLRQRTGKRINQLLRSKDGRGSVYLRGVVAIMEIGTPQWVSSSEREAVEVLKKIRSKGVKAVNRLYELPDVITNEEAVLLDKLEAFGSQNLKLKREVSAGRFFADNYGCTLKSIDAVGVDDKDTHWVIEAERLLNHEAIGQAIVYEVLYGRDNPGVDIQKAVVCGEASTDFLQVCKTNNIAVLIVKGEKVIDGLKLLNEGPDTSP